MNNQTLMSYDFMVDTYETDLIVSQTYATLDTVYFNYDDQNDKIMSIDFQASGGNRTTRFIYTYNDNDQVESYTDLTDVSNPRTEYYHYDLRGNLDTIIYNNGDSFNYDYDNDGNLVAINVDINDESINTSFDIADDTNEWLYDRTTIDSEETLTLDYNYLIDASNLDPLERLQSISYLVNGDEAFNQSYVYEGYTHRINTITYTFTGLETGFMYIYNYDDIGQIITEKYYEESGTGYALKARQDYTYDDMNQLIRVDMRDHRVTEETYTDTNQTIYYYYDDKCNLTDIKRFSYGEPDYIEITPPTAYQTSEGTTDIFVVVTGDSTIEVGDSLSLSYTYYLNESMMPPNIVPMPMRTTIDWSTVDTSQAGYYLLEGTATDKFNSGQYDIHFGVVITVGTPSGGPNIPAYSLSYTYDDTWLDQLESYKVKNGDNETTYSITYDDQGNPTIIENFIYDGNPNDHADLSWEGRQLVGIDIYDTETHQVARITYTYNDQGIRTRKYVDTDADGINDIKYEYVLSGDVLVSEIYYTGSSNWVEEYQIIYTYDVDGSPIGFTYIDGINDADYLYVTNLEGDVTKIINTTGDIVVEYTYDAYGNILEITGSSATGIGIYNTMRYRGYKYDDEIGMYYLNSRYYNPEIGRFINADGMLGEVGQLGTHNMYAYCANNPVMFTDSTGQAWWNPFSWTGDTWAAIGSAALVVAVVGLTAVAAITTGGIAGAAIMAVATGMGFGAAIGGYSAYDSGTNIAAGILGGAVKGGASGAAIGLGIMTGGGVFSAMGGLAAFGGALGTNFGAGMLHYAIDNGMNNRSLNWGDALGSGGMQMLSGAFAFAAGGLIGVSGFYNISGQTKMFSGQWFGNVAAGQLFRGIAYYPFAFTFSLIQRTKFSEVS